MSFHKPSFNKTIEAETDPKFEEFEEAVSLFVRNVFYHADGIPHNKALYGDNNRNTFYYRLGEAFEDLISGNNHHNWLEMKELKHIPESFFKYIKQSNLETKLCELVKILEEFVAGGGIQNPEATDSWTDLLVFISLILDSNFVKKLKK